MSRLIDADMLKSAITRYSEKLLSHKNLSIVKNAIREVLDDINFAIDIQPSFNAVEIVRCKDCEFFREHLSMNCVYHVSAVSENWFCSQGKKVTE